MNTRGPWRWAGWGLALWALVVSAQAGESESPEPTDRMEHHAQRLLAARCTVCHSIELIVQQRLDRDHWGMIVKKMSTWGAQVSESEQETLVTYLAARYHAEAGPIVAEEPAPKLFPSIDKAQGHAKRGQGLYEQNCLPCHGPLSGGRRRPKTCRQSRAGRCAALLGDRLEWSQRYAALGHDIEWARDRGHPRLASNLEVIDQGGRR